MPWYKYIAGEGDVVSIESFGASGPAPEVFELLGLTVDGVVAKAEALVK